VPVIYATTYRLNLPRCYTPSPEISSTLSEAVDFPPIISVANAPADRPAVAGKVRRDVGLFDREKGTDNENTAR
jgi:hypothetical protein